MATKPILGKCYGSIGHLPGSKTGPGDHVMTGGQVKILTEKARDKYDEILVQEKLDGSCVGVMNIDDQLVPLIRAGYRAADSKRSQHHHFHDWAFNNYPLFDWLPLGWRVVGEWLLQVHSIRYDIEHRSPFVAFDIFDSDNKRICYSDFCDHCDRHRIETAPLIHRGGPCSIEKAEHELGEYGYYGALDPAEGMVWRVERKGQVDFLGKYVRKSHEPGKYLDQEMMNMSERRFFSALQLNLGGVCR